MTSVELAFAVKSPLVAIFIVIFCFLPTMVAIFQYLRKVLIIDQPPPEIMPGDIHGRLELTDIPA